jgi:hypothetical protein
MSTGIGVGISSVFTSRPAGGPSIILEYSTSDYCETPVPSVITPSVIQPAPPAGVFTSSASGLVVNVTSGVFNVGVSQPGSYIITYTVGTQSATFPINIGPVIDATITGDSATCVGNAPVPADLTAVAGYSNYEWFKDNVSVQNGSSNTYTPAFNVAGTFTYKVIITDSSLSSVDCTKTSLDFTFTVNALPTISIADATGGFCSGSSTTITTTVSAGTVFAWYKDDVLIVGQTGSTLTVSEAGEYTATVTDGNGCTSLPSTGLEIEQFDSPTVTIATVPGTTICTGDTATLTANPTGGTGPYTYLWSNSDTTQEISVAPTTTTTYTVTVTDDNGCTGAASQEITASTNGTAIASINNDDAMSFNGVDSYVAFPNLTLSSNEYTISLWIYSDQGANVGYFLTNGNTAGGSSAGFKIDNNGADIGRLEYWDGANNKTFGTISSPASWNHVAFVANVSGSTITSYINGSVDTTATSVNVQTMYNLIGAYTPTGGNKFVGKLDEVAVWDSALSSCDVKGIYDATTTVNGQPKSANLLDTNTTIPAPVYWNRMGDS